MKLFLYNYENTFIHKLDPRTKLFLMIFLFVLAVLVTNIPALIVLALFSLLLCYQTRCLDQLKTLFIPVVSLTIFTVLIWAAPAKFTLQGIQYGFAMAFSFNIMLLIGLVFLATTRLEEFTSSLIYLGIPYHLSFSFSLAFRLLPTFVNTTLIITQAQKSRGLDLETGSPLKRLRKHLPLLVPVFICALRQADLLAMALEARGFGSRDQKRTLYYQLAFTKRDYWCLTVASLLMVGALIMKWKGLLS